MAAEELFILREHLEHARRRGKAAIGGKLWQQGGEKLTAEAVQVGVGCFSIVSVKFSCLLKWKVA